MSKILSRNSVTINCMMLRCLAVAVMMVVCGAPSFAKRNPGTALGFVTNCLDARSSSMAGTRLGVLPSSSYASAYNSAALSFADNQFSSSLSYSGLGDGYRPSLGVSGRIGKKFGLGMTASMSLYEKYELVDILGKPQGYFSPSDALFTAGFSYRFLPKFSLGASVKYAREMLVKDVSYGAIMADVLLMAKFSECHVVAGVVNIGEKITVRGDESYPLMAGAVLGAGWDALVAEKHRICLGADLNYYFCGILNVSAAAEYAFDKWLSARAGYCFASLDGQRRSDISAGLGFKFWKMSLDGAYVMPLGDAPLKNHFALTLGFSF